MKKLFALVITLVMIMSAAAFAAPETVDLVEMTQDELNDLINRAKIELRKFGNASEAGTVILDHDGILVKFAGVDFGFMGLEFKLIIENNSQSVVRISADKMYINGWETMPLLSAEVESGKKSRETIDAMNAEKDADVSSADDLETVEFIFEIREPDSYNVLYTSDKIIINF